MALKTPLVLYSGIPGQLSSTDTITASLLTGKFLRVDGVNGNNSTGARGRWDLPFLTLSGAVGAAGITSGDVIFVGPGTFTETATVTLPSGVSLIGAGIDVTKIVNSTTLLSSNHVALVPGNNSVLADFTVDVSGTSGSAAAIGCASSDTAFSNALAFRLKTVGATDGFVFNNSSVVSFQGFDCFVSVNSSTASSPDGVLSQAASTVIEFFNTIINATASSSPTNVNGLRATLGTIRFFGGEINMSGAATANRGGTTQGGTLELHMVRLNTASPGFDFHNSSGTLLINNVVRSDGLALVTLGTIYIVKAATSEPVITAQDYFSSFTVPDGGRMNQPGRLTLSSNERAVLQGTGRLVLSDDSIPFQGSFQPGSFTLTNDQWLLQYKRLTLVGNQRITLQGNARIVLTDLTPGGRLVLSGSGGNV